jgi:predicted metal-dependent peptidase
MNPHRALQSALTSLLLYQPFFGSLALRLRLQETSELPTAATDGITLCYNPLFIASLTPEQIKGLVCHEVMHVAHGHIWRRDEREMRRWNIAADHEINPIIEAAGMQLPPGGCNDPQYANLSAEAIYSRLPEVPPNTPPTFGELLPAPAGTDLQALEAEWQIAVVQAATQAQQHGNLPAGFERLLASIQKPPCRDLTAALLEHVQRSRREDYSWALPSKRYLPHGLYLPDMRSDALPPVVAAVDTSGSIDQEILRQYAGALSVVLDECKPECLHILACDAEVTQEYELFPGDEVPLQYPGGGGTDFRPVFRNVAERDLQPCALIYLTDTWGTPPEEAPDYPVLWVVIDEGYQRLELPFGQTIWL